MNAAIGFFARIAAGTVLLLLAATVSGCGGGGGSSSGPAAGTDPIPLAMQMRGALGNQRLNTGQGSQLTLPIEFTASLVGGAPAVTVIVSDQASVLENNPYAPAHRMSVDVAVPEPHFPLATLLAWYDPYSCNDRRICLINGNEGPDANPPTRFAVRIYVELGNVAGLHTECVGTAIEKDPRCFDPNDSDADTVTERFVNAAYRAMQASNNGSHPFVNLGHHASVTLLRNGAEFNWRDPHARGNDLQTVPVKIQSNESVLDDVPVGNASQLFTAANGSHDLHIVFESDLNRDPVVPRGVVRVYTADLQNPFVDYALRIYMNWNNYNYLSNLDSQQNSQQRSLAESDVRARLGESFAGAGAFGDAFGVAPSTESVESRLRGLSDGGGVGGVGGSGRGSFGLWEGGDENGRGWVSLGRVDRNFGVLGSGDGLDGLDGRGRRNGWEFGDAPDNPFAALVGDGFAAGGESRFDSGLFRVAVFGDAPEDSGLDPDARRWGNWALRGIGSGVGSGIGFPDVGTLAGLSAVGENVRGGMAEFSDFHIRSGFAWAVQAGTLDESGAILSGAGDFANLRTRTTFAGVRWRASFGDKWGGVGTAHFGLAEARSDGALRRGTFRLGAYSAGIGRGDVWRTGDAVMLRLRQPLRAEGGGMFAVFPDGVSGWVDAVPSGRQLDFDAVYRWRFGERADGVFAGTLRRDAGHSRRNSWDGGAMFRVDMGF